MAVVCQFLNKEENMIEYQDGVFRLTPVIQATGSVYRLLATDTFITVQA